MKRNSQLSGVLHVLLHMAERDEPSTSEELARAMDTNPVVVRRVLAGLRDRGIVRSGKGHGGGWTMARPLQKITLRDIHEALGAPELLAIGHRAQSPECLVERAVNAALGAVFEDAEAVLLAGFEAVTLAQLSADFHKNLRAAKKRGARKVSHAH